MKKIIDIFQFTLDLPGPLALIACVLFVLGFIVAIMVSAFITRNRD